jgi:hypothetical protein
MPAAFAKLAAASQDKSGSAIFPPNNGQVYWPFSRLRPLRINMVSVYQGAC